VNNRTSEFSVFGSCFFATKIHYYTPAVIKFIIISEN